MSIFLVRLYFESAFFRTMSKRNDYENNLAIKSKRFCKFQKEWLNQPEYEQWLAKNIDENDDGMTAYCKLCHVTISVKYDGVKILRKHARSIKHTQLDKNKQQNDTIFKFYPTVNTSEENKVIAAELILTYHGVKHGHSYLSQDRNNKLIKQICSDSKIGPKIHCGRTKAEALVENVLAPYALELVLSEIVCSPISVATDASNKGNQKMYPVVVRYFSKEYDVKTAILNFYEDSNESSTAIANKIMECLKNKGLEANKVVAYGADNASVNFGKHKSVFQNLKKGLNNENMIPGHCNAHIIHNTAKHALKLLNYDVETFVMRVFSEFSSSAKNVSTLHDFFDFLNSDYIELLRYTPTRFLTLFPVIDRVLSSWSALKLYFLEKGENDCSKIIWSFFGKNDVGNLPEVYVYFVHNLMSFLSTNLKHLESEYILVTDVFDVFDKLRMEVKARIEKNFFGFKATQMLRNLPINEQLSFKEDALSAYKRILNYLEKWFDYSENSIYYMCKPFNLAKEIELEEAVRVAKKLGIDFDGDDLFSELVTLNKIRQTLCSEQQSISTAPLNNVCSIWMNYFRSSDSPNLLKIVQHIFIIPPNNAYVEYSVK